MSIIDTLITDRTQADVKRAQALRHKALTSALTAEEETEYMVGMKGAYTHYIDMNRVAQACAYIYARLAAEGYLVAGYTALKDDWIETDVIIETDLTVYINTIKAIKAVWPTVTPVPDSMPGINYADANHIEQLLVEVDEMATRLMSIFIRTNMPWAICGNYMIFARN